jgi:hypothetical protein
MPSDSTKTLGCPVSLPEPGLSEDVLGVPCIG